MPIALPGEGIVTSNNVPASDHLNNHNISLPVRSVGVESSHLIDELNLLSTSLSTDKHAMGACKTPKHPRSVCLIGALVA